MRKPFALLRSKMSREAQEKSLKKSEKMMKAMKLCRLREVRHLTQESLAKRLHVRQANISKIENRADMYISTLREYVKAIGGHLEITARFPEGTVPIDQFKSLGR